MRLIDADTVNDHIVGWVDLRSCPTIEAIPIEWIKRWANRNCMYCYDYDYPTEKHDSWYAIRDMIEDWGKENGN